MVKKVLHMFAMNVLFVTTSSLFINDLGKVFFSSVLERILFIVSQVLIFLFLNLLKQDSLCICLAARLLLKPAIIRCQVSPSCKVFR